MKGMHRTQIIVALVCAVRIVFIAKRRKPEPETVPATLATQKAASVKTDARVASKETLKDKALPRLVDLGASKCVHCKMMAPILEDLGNWRPLHVLHGLNQPLGELLCQKMPRKN
ncbi:MAG: hypothetical protein ACOC6C_00980 [Verrucomicrobiota bacterium]